jgi:hypothetical protein
MTQRLPVPPAPGPLETYCQQNDYQVRSDQAIRRHWALICSSAAMACASISCHEPAAPNYR